MKIMNKQITSFIVSAAMLLSSTTFSIDTNMKSEATVKTTIEQGDVNDDGVVDCFDLVTVRKNMNNNIEYKYDVMPEYFLDTLTYYVLEAYDSFNINMVIDDDNDGITNWIEIEFLNTSPDSSDTDNDGLPDKYEIVSLQSDPTASGTDANDDADNDGLSNLEEYLNGTEPLENDSDSDGISDYNELKVYKTNPIISDTDGDGLDDYSELQLNLNPLLSKTHDVLDSELKIEQSILATSDVFNAINTEDSPYELSIKINTNGYAEKELSVMESGYSHIIDSDAIIGSSVEINVSGICNPDSLTIEYKVDEEIYKSYTTYNYKDIDELNGIKNLCIFKYFEEINMLLPVETKFNGDIVYTETDELGTYCLVNLSRWFNSLNISPTDIKKVLNNPTDYSSQISLANEEIDIQTDLGSNSTESNKSTKPIDIVFLLQIDNSEDIQTDAFYKDVYLIENFSKYVFDNFCDARVYIIKFSYNNGIIPETVVEQPNFKDLYASNKDELNDILHPENPYFTIRMTYPISPFTLGLYDTNIAPTVDPPIELRDNAYIYQFINNSYESSETEVDFCQNNTGIFSLISDKEFNSYTEETFKKEKIKKVFEEAIEAKHGLYIPNFLENPSNNKTDEELTDDTLKKIIYHFNLKEELYKYDVLVNNRFNTLVLADELNEDNKVDTDNDGITDWDELNSQFIEYDSEGKAVPCTLQKVIDAGYAGNYLYNAGKSTTGREQMLNSIRNKKVYIMKSDPTEEDSDHDGLYDNKALFRKCEWGTMPVAPADTSLLHAGPKNMWKEHIERMMNYDVPTEYMDNQKGLSFSFNKVIKKANNGIVMFIPPYFRTGKKGIDMFIKSITGTDDHAEQLVSLLLRVKPTLNKHAKDIRPYILYLKSYFEGDTVAGAYLLNFIKDENGVVYHSQPETWQKEFGYTELYDDVFRTGSYMNYGRFEFESEGKNYALWTWKGDYWNMQSGAEVGLYVYDKNLTGNRYYDVVDFELPMTLSLYNYNSEDDIETLFNWAPREKQWWVTGFNPEFKEPDPEAMVSITSIDLSDEKYEHIYNSIRDYIYVGENYHDYLKSEHMILDKENKVLWIQWYNTQDETSINS